MLIQGLFWSNTQNMTCRFLLSEAVSCITYSFCNVRALVNNLPSSNMIGLFNGRFVDPRSPEQTPNCSFLPLKATLSDKEILLTLEWLKENLKARHSSIEEKLNINLNMLRRGGSCHHGDFYSLLDWAQNERGGVFKAKTLK